MVVRGRHKVSGWWEVRNGRLTEEMTGGEKSHVGWRDTHVNHWGQRGRGQGGRGPPVT